MFRYLQSAAVAASIIVSLTCPGTIAGAQTRTVRDSVTAYGARLDAAGEPAGLNPNRLNNRVDSRLDTRLSLRVERYRPQTTTDPTAAFAVKPAQTSSSFAPGPTAAPEPVLGTGVERPDDATSTVPPR